MPKSAESKARVRGSAKLRVAGQNVEAIEELLAEASAAKKEWEKKSPEWRKANPFIPEKSLVIARITASQGGGSFTIEAPGRAPMQVRAKGSAALADAIAQKFKTVKLAADQWPIVICVVPESSSHVKTGEVLALLEGSHVTQFGELGFKVPLLSAEDDLFEPSAAGGGEDEVDINDL
jgi:hypothetical protein